MAKKKFKIELHTFPSGFVCYHGDGYLTPKAKDRIELSTDPIDPSSEVLDTQISGTLNPRYVKALRRYRDSNPSGGHSPLTFTQQRKVMEMLTDQFLKDFG